MIAFPPAPALRANAFVDQLAEMPLDQWLAIGRRCTEREEQSWYEAAFAALEQTIRTRGLRVEAWYVRDAIETSVFLATHSVCGWTARDRRVFAAAHAAAERAALGLMAQGQMSPADVLTLLDPFAAVVARFSGH